MAKIPKKFNSHTEKTVNENKFAKKKKQKKNNKLGHRSQSDDTNIRKSIKKNIHILSNRFKQRSKNEDSSSLLDPKIATIVDTRNDNGNKSMLRVRNKKKFNKKKQQKSVHEYEEQQHLVELENRSSNVHKLKMKKKHLRKKTELNKIQNFDKKDQKNITKSTSKKLKSLTNKKTKQDRQNENVFIRATENENSSQEKTNVHKLDVRRLEKMFANKNKQVKRIKENPKPETLRERMMNKLRSSRFRYLNESMYNSESSESKKYFKDDPDSFVAYHDGYKQQIEQWPVNPLDVVISSIKKMPKDHVIADFGCGEARLADSVTQKVHSFDFVSLNERVTACDMAHTPLLTNGVHVVVFCLSLMGTNLNDYLIEANRVLKNGGILKVAEVESRFEQIDDFIKALRDYGFKNTWKDLSHNLFYFLDFKKEKDIGGKKNKLPAITLKPCLYKKR